MKKIKNALVLSGGGFKGAYEVGVLEYLIKKKKVKFDVITSTSVGSLNAIKLVEGEHTIDQLRDLWLKEVKELVKNKT